MVAHRRWGCGKAVISELRIPPIVLDTNVVVAGACRKESSRAYQLLMRVLDGQISIFLTNSIALEYADVLLRPAIRRLTGLSPTQSNLLVMDLIALSTRVHTKFTWRPNLHDESDNKFVEAAIYGAATIITYNTRDYTSRALLRYGWRVSTPQEFLEHFFEVD